MYRLILLLLQRVLFYGEVGYMILLLMCAGVLNISYLSPIFGTSQRGNAVILIGKYRFNCAQKYGNKTRWVCVKAKAGCRATIYTSNNAIVRVTGMHEPLAHTSVNRV